MDEQKTCKTCGHLVPDVDEASGNCPRCKGLQDSGSVGGFGLPAPAEDKPA